MKKRAGTAVLVPSVLKSQDTRGSCVKSADGKNTRMVYRESKSAPLRRKLALRMRVSVAPFAHHSAHESYTVDNISAKLRTMTNDRILPTCMQARVGRQEIAGPCAGASHPHA
jgi:hypothetical protein